MRLEMEVRASIYMSKESIISPLAIDLGAKYTGAYLAHYKAYSTIDKIEKEAKVYQLEKNNYTLLMEDRTAARHQRRGHDRRQMVKRLFKLIWEKGFALPWDQDIQQTISFLLNRRGFSFLTEEYDAEILSRFPREAHALLPKELQIQVNEHEEYDFANALTEWAGEGEAKVKELFEEILYKAYCEKIRKNCQEKKADNDIVKEGTGSVKLADTPKFVFERLFAHSPKLKKRLETESYSFNDKNDKNKKITAKYNKGASFNIFSFINNNDLKTAKAIQDKLPTEQKEWLFNPDGKFDIEKSEEKLTDFENINCALHLQHLAFALHNVLDELQSGGRYRSKYFDEVKEVLKNTRTKGSKKDGSPVGEDYIDRFCKKLHKKEYNPFTHAKLSNLIAHLSNLELKPLRKYFNDEKHKKGDVWEEKVLSKIFENWILREWRVNLEKDKRKAKDEPGDYKKLRKKWNEYAKQKPGKVLDFFLESEAFYTIPPYQDNNNRRPPKCQSLILSSAFLKHKYPDWESWLIELKKLEIVSSYLDAYESELKSLESGKKKAYFSDEKTGELRKDSGRRSSKDLNARVLQFIFDRVKNSDPLNLNEIFSHTKKWRQEQSTEQEKKEEMGKLEKSITSSQLPGSLKSPRNKSSKDLFSQDSFLHLVCAYYKLRQRARDGRLYIHPEYRYVKERGYENTGRFDDKKHLLTYCNHKPRQKKYQLLGDLAGVLQLAPQKLAELMQKQNGSTVDEKLFNYLKDVRALKANCEKAAKEQKERRGQLKSDIQSVYGLIHHKTKEQSLSQKEVKQILQVYRVKEAFKLYSFYERAKKVYLSLTGALYEAERQKQQEDELEKNPATAVYLLAQINNIAFKERNGNAKTCAVCSADNAKRMQTVASEKNREDHAKAQRLPAIEMRLIDGAVMRMARIVGGAIARDKWKKIESALREDQRVHIPIITESNRFEFEPNLREIKNKSKKEDNDIPKKAEEISANKNERIKDASQGICPYTGNEVSGGDKDHIIPRSSRWGTLNDEANLIWASDRGNKEIKKEKEFALSDLKANYKKKQFGTSEDKKIKAWIIDQIGDKEGEDFKFGKYRSFINLNPNQQKAFRHALFLMGDDTLRKKVIRAIDNRTRTLVNGTQRYFAEVLANKLYKEAKSIGKEELLSFDYFGVEAQDSTRGDGIHNLRKELVEHYREDLGKYDKEKGKTQGLYSHLIDAQITFCMAVDAHRDEGSLKLKLGDSGLWSRVDKKTGEIKAKKHKIYDAGLFNLIEVKESSFEAIRLERLLPKAEKQNISHRPLFNENAVAMHFLRLIEIESPQKDSIYLNGFLALEELKKCLGKKNKNRFDSYEKYGKLLNADEIEKYTSLYKEQFKVKEGEGIQLLEKFGAGQQNIRVYSLDKKKVYGFLIDNFNTASNPHAWREADIKALELLCRLWYFTQRKNIIVKAKNKETIYSPNPNDIKTGGFSNPQIEEVWAKVKSKIDESKNIHKQLKEYFLYEKENGKDILKNNHGHQKVRKDFSLPISKSTGFLIRKQNWRGEYVYYCRPASNDFTKTVLHKNEDGVSIDKDERLSNAYRKHNIFFCFENFKELKKGLSPIDKALAIDPNVYYPAEIPQGFEDFIVKAQNKRTDGARPRFKFFLNTQKRMGFDDFRSFILRYPFRKLQDLNAGLKKECFGTKEKAGGVSNPQKLEACIKRIEKMKEKPKNLLPTLQIYKKYWESSQIADRLEYQAQGTFSISQR